MAGEMLDFGDLTPPPTFSPMRTFFNVLDYPGNLVRGTLMGHPLDALRGNKFSGADILEQYAGMKNKRGKLDWADVPAIGLEIGLDPLTYLTGGLSKVGKAQGVLKKAGIDKWGDDAIRALGKTLGATADATKGQQRVMKAINLLDDKVNYFQSGRSWGEQVRRGERDLLRFMGKKIPIPNEEKVASAIQRMGQAIGKSAPVRAITKPFISGFGKYDALRPDHIEKLDEAAVAMKSRQLREAIKAVDMQKGFQSRAAQLAETLGMDKADMLEQIDTLIETKASPFGAEIGKYSDRMKNIDTLLSRATDPAQIAALQGIKERTGLKIADFLKQRDAYRARFGKGLAEIADPNEIEKFAAEIKAQYPEMLSREMKSGVDIAEFGSPRLDYAKRVTAAPSTQKKNVLQRMLGLFKRGPMSAKSGATVGRKEVYRDLMKPEIVEMQQAKIDKIRGSLKISLTKAQTKLEKYLAKGKLVQAEQLKRKMASRAALAEARIARIPLNVFKTDPIEALTVRQLEHAQMLPKAEFMREALGTVGMIKDPALAKQSGWSSVAEIYKAIGLKASDEIKDAYVMTERVAPIVDRFKRWGQDEAVKGALGMYDKALAAWKGMHTSIHPAFTVRNALSGAVQNLQEGNVAYPQMAKLAKDILSGKPLAAPIKMIDGTVLSNSDEALRFLIENQIVTSDVMYDLMAHVKSGDVHKVSELLDPKGISLRRGLKDNLKTAFTQSPLKTGREASQNVENVNRAALALDQLINKGTSKREALSAVNRAMFDYGDLSEFERNVMRRLVPFYTFARKNLPYQMQWAAKNPRVPLNIGRALGLTKDNTDRVMPAYLREQAAIPLGSDKEGNPQYLSGLGLPFEEAISRLPPMSLRPKDWERYGQKMASMLTPALKIPAELTFNKNTFTGRPVSDMDRVYSWVSKLPDAVKDKVGYREWTDKSGKQHYRVDPYYLYMLTNLGAGRFYSTANRVADDRKSALVRALNTMTGVNVTSVDEGRERGYAEREAFMNLVEELKRQGMAEDFTTQYLTEKGKADPRLVELFRQYRKKQKGN
jgi:hypothetical protein